MKEGTLNHFVSGSCHGELCVMCRLPATHKVGEEIPPDDSDQNRHNLTAYVCCGCFRRLVGPAAPCKNFLTIPRKKPEMPS